MGMWKKLGCVNLTGIKAQLHLNTLSETGANEGDRTPEQNPQFRSYPIGSKGKASTTVGLNSIRFSFLGTVSPMLLQIQPLIFDLNVVGKTLTKAKWVGRATAEEKWHNLADLDIDLSGPTEYILRA